MRVIIVYMRKIINIDFQDDQHEYTAEVEVNFHIDKHYGEDADRNRSMSMVFLDDFEVRGIINENGETVAITEEMIDRIDIGQSDLLDGMEGGGWYDGWDDEE